MKWSIAGLLALGLVAAVCASMLVVSFQNRAMAGPTDPQTGAVARPDVQVLVATRDFEVRSVVKAGDLEVRTLAHDAAPKGYYSDPVQVVGKVLVAPVTEGQAFTPACFASEGSGMHLASALAPGMRAVSVSLSDKMGIESLLYPGSSVDVIATMKLDSGGSQQPISVTLLDNVLVLAIGPRTIVSPEENVRTSAVQQRTTVTLLVTPEQAQKLKLALEQGSVSLTLRNPMDSEATPSEGTRLSGLSPLFEAAEQQERERREQRLQAELITEQQRELERERLAADQARAELQRLREERERSAAEADSAPTPGWQATILRGGVAETKVFALDTDEKN